MSSIFARKMARKLDSEELAVVTGGVIIGTRGAQVVNSCDPSGPAGRDFGTQDDIVYVE